jgi:hypothetical protein
MKRPAKPSKYHNVRTTVDGIGFASASEARRYSQLKLFAKAGEIVNLRLQPRYPLKIEGVLICTYVADFAYDRRQAEGGWRPVIEDVKGVVTDVFRIKRNLMRVIYGAEIEIVK